MTRHVIPISLSALLAAVLVGCTSTRTPDVRPQDRVYVIMDITVHDSATYARYRDAIAPVIAAHGGRYLVRSGAARFDDNPASGVVSPEGAWYPDRIIVLEFDSRAAFDGFVTSAGYRAAAPLRAASARTRSVVVNGYAPES